MAGSRGEGHTDRVQNRCNLRINWRGGNEMSFRNPNKLKKNKKVVKKVARPPKVTTKTPTKTIPTKNIPVKKPNEKSL